MTQQQEEGANCIIGQDYPPPILEHDERRQRAIELYRNA
jgi:deoxyribodipyrimidine photo-lyase